MARQKFTSAPEDISERYTLDILPCRVIKCDTCNGSFIIHFKKDLSVTCINCPLCTKAFELLARADDTKTTRIYVISDARLQSPHGPNIGSSPDDFNSHNASSTRKLTADGTSGHSNVGALRAKSDGLLCDVCYIASDSLFTRYCRECKQKLCGRCKELHSSLTVSRGHHTLNLMPVNRTIEHTLVQKLSEKTGSINHVAELIDKEIGLQACLNFRDCSINICGPTVDIVDLAEQTLQQLDNAPPLDGTSIRINKSHVVWMFYGDMAKIIRTIFKEELSILTETFKGVAVSLLTNTLSAQNDINLSKTWVDGENILKVQCDFDKYKTVASIIDEILTAVNDLHKVEVARPKKDEFRLKIYIMYKDTDNDVVCTEEKVDNSLKLVIRGRDSEVVQDIKQEFLSLFCKECSVCQCESSRPMYLDCKHVLCHQCVKHSACLNNGMQCQVCSVRQDTPIRSLQVQCIQLIDAVLGNQVTGTVRSPAKPVLRKLPATNRQQMSVKLPKYLLKKWKQTTGGLLRLKSLIQNNYGFQVAGTDDNLKIYGNQQEILELAIYSLETLNNKATETGIGRRITDGNIEWRFRGEFARILYFLFNKEINTLQKKFQSVSFKVYTESLPSVVEIKCSYQEYIAVKYEIDELENAARSLQEDEYIQPKTFYYNVKVKDFVQSKKRDDKIVCELNEKSNLNVIKIKARKKAYISAAKEELSNW